MSDPFLPKRPHEVLVSQWPYATVKRCHALSSLSLKVFDVRPNVRLPVAKKQHEGRERGRRDDPFLWHMSLTDVRPLYRGFPYDPVRPLYRSLPMPKVRDSRMSKCHCLSKKPRSGTFFIWPLMAVYGFSL